MFENSKVEHLNRFCPFPSLFSQTPSEEFSAEQIAFYCEKADAIAAQNIWSPIPASVFMQFCTNGNRKVLEDLYFDKRTNLTLLVTAECMTREGKYLPSIVDALWSICEESSWVVSAHNNHYHADPTTYNILPDVEEEKPFVDLFIAETAAMLAFAIYFLEKELDEISPLIVNRVRYEINKRVFVPYLKCDDYAWMGIHNYNQKLVNNWNPWINSNVMICTLLLEKDEARKNKILQKVLQTLDIFLVAYGEDGGCDEGPDYWGAAGAVLFECLEMFHIVSDGKISYFDNSLIQNIGKYILRVNIANGNFANFADGNTGLEPLAELIHRYGARIQDEDLAAFGVSLYEYAENKGLSIPKFRAYGYYSNTVNYATMKHAYEQQKETGFAVKRDLASWLPQLQVLNARQSTSATDGFCMVAKGGHNNESHNHNDVGNTIVYYAGKPVLIDVGVETYTAKTFSDQRYTIWTMQSGYHNLPAFNGQMQGDGREFEAKDVCYEESADKVTLSMSLRDCYPTAAKLEAASRSLTLDRVAQSVSICDRYACTEALAPTVWSFMTYAEPVLCKDGMVQIALDESDSIVFSYDATQLTPSVERIPITDPRQERDWKGQVYRLQLTSKEAVLAEEACFTLQKKV